ncbi:MAG TPA: ATP-binding cassette domain-containing protein [Chryseolinea sp.]|nr:ATP-binding cassette domain-containing protein [Chryseolinea sp.]
MKDLLEFDGIELSYGTQRILSGIYMKCTVGEVVGILGRNGSGKSSLFKVVFGSQSAEHRSIRMNGSPLPEDFIRQRIIGYLPQTDLIPSHITIAKALDLYEIENDELLRYFPELNEQLSFRPHELSGGFRRVIELMLILKSRSRFCLLDEPFSGVMPVHVETIRTMLMEAKAEKGIILTDHLYRSVMSSADRLYLLSNGSTYPVRSPDDLISRGYLTPNQPLD